MYKNTVKVGIHDGTSPCNKSQRPTLVPATSPTNSNQFEFIEFEHVHDQLFFHRIQTSLNSCNLNQFEFVGLVAGTKFWSLQLDFAAKMASSHDATSPRGGCDLFLCYVTCHTQ